MPLMWIRFLHFLVSVNAKLSVMMFWVVASVLLCSCYSNMFSLVFNIVLGGDFLVFLSSSINRSLWDILHFYICMLSDLV